MTHAAGGRYTPRVPSPKRITSAVYAAFVVVAAAFVISSTVQIARSVLAEPAPGAPTPASVAVAPACASGVRTLAVAVDRGVAAAAAATDRDEAEKRYRAARSPEWDDAKRRELVQPCGTDPHGDDAVAAVTRLDRAAEGAIRRQTDELGPVRRAVDSFIR
ncbi:MAG: hypothetical protein JWP87_3164 [Labilithrix sp.]|nr:hypothetical protein [Labilithrix sp.]